MFVLEPIFHKTIWGGNRLAGVYGKAAEGLAHLYVLRCADKNSNVILNGKFAGKKLFDVTGKLPLSIALVDASLNLSIQVHPGGAAAKYESYYFLEPPQIGYIYCGIDRNLSLEEIRRSAENSTILKHLKRSYVASGDYIFIPPSTVHALTAGSFVYEIEQGDDNTYRLFDYERIGIDGKKRELQLEQALDVLDTSLQANTLKYTVNTVVSERTYATKRLSNISAYVNDARTSEYFTFLSGNASVDGVTLKTGMTVVLEPGEKLQRLAVEDCIIAWAIH